MSFGSRSAPNYLTGVRSVNKLFFEKMCSKLFDGGVNKLFFEKMCCIGILTLTLNPLHAYMKTTGDFLARLLD